MSELPSDNVDSQSEQREWVKPILTEANIAGSTQASNSPDPTDDGGGNPGVDCVPA